MSKSSGCTVVKVGGSLYDVPDLGEQLRVFLAEATRGRVLLVPGGGAATDAIRTYDRHQKLGEEASHWLALRMLTVNAHFLAGLMGATVTSDVDNAAWLSVLDMHAFAVADEARPDHLPHLWTVTSDSLAVRVAQVAGARELILVKSVAWSGSDWTAAARAGVVDAYFTEALRGGRSIDVRVENLLALL